MNWACLSLFLFATATPSFAQDVAAAPEDREISALRTPVRQAKEALATAEEKSVLNLQRWYATKLEKLEAETQAGGNLDHVILIRKEKARIIAQEQPTLEQINAMPASLRNLRASYDGALKKIRDDAAARRDPLDRKLLANLEALQIRLTKTGEIDRALLVKTEKEKLIAERPAQQASPPKPSPGTVASRPAANFFSINQGPKQAKVEAENTVLAPLKIGEDVLGFTNKLHWVQISEAFQGFRFTRLVANSPTLKFKVLSDGMVYLACTKGWGASGPTDWQSEVTTEEQLRKKGWNRERGELKDEEAHGWWVFSRNCKAGEDFTFRTAKYRSPILLVK
jgi:hypothetical protein